MAGYPTSYGKAAPQWGPAYGGGFSNAGTGGGYVDPTFAPYSPGYMQNLQSQLISAFGNLGGMVADDGSTPFGPGSNSPMGTNQPNMARSMELRPGDPYYQQYSWGGNGRTNYDPILGPYMPTVGGDPGQSSPGRMPPTMPQYNPRVGTNPPNMGGPTPITAGPDPMPSNIGLPPAPSPFGDSPMGYINGQPFQPFQTPGPLENAPNGNPIIDYANGYYNPGQMANLIGLFGPQPTAPSMPPPPPPPAPPAFGPPPPNPRQETARPVEPILGPPPPSPRQETARPVDPGPRVGTNPPGQNGPVRLPVDRPMGTNPVRSRPMPIQGGPRFGTPPRPGYEMQYATPPAYSGNRFSYTGPGQTAQTPSRPAIQQTPGGNVPLNGAALQGRKLPVRRTLYGLQTNSQEIPLMKGMMSAAGIDPESAFGEFSAFLPKGGRAAATVF